MTISLAGAHRTGKSTLARAFSEQSGLPFVQTNASSIFAEMGLDPAAQYPLSVRLDVQERILARFGEQYATIEDGEFIADRCPIDLLAYTLADVNQERRSDELEARLMQYRKDCIAMTNRFFSVLVVVQPGIPVVPEPGKASLSSSYIEHVAALVMGLVVSEEVAAQHFYIPRRTLDLDKRVECLNNSVARTVSRHQQMIADRREAGAPIVFH